MYRDDRSIFFDLQTALFVVAGQQLLHGIQPYGLLQQEACCTQCTDRKYFTVFRMVGDGQDLLIRNKLYFVLSDDIAAADRMDADLVGLTLTVIAAASILIMVFADNNPMTFFFLILDLQDMV